jgi:Ser/Thr protein kinase RdoA (MazF antagonist)
MSWDERAVFGKSATWGDWRAAPNVTQDVREVLERVESVVKARLTAYGKNADRYGLIHADLRLANVLIDGESLHLIDFDDCGFGWFGYDFAAAISFMENDPSVPTLKAAWLSGYRRVRKMDEDDMAMIDTFVMLRRLALLAWIGSHMESTEPQALAPEFARISAALGAAYLEMTDA